MTYLDHDMVSGFGKGDFPDEQLIALNRITDLFMAGKHALTTSEVSLRELEPYRGEHRSDIEKFYAVLQKVPLVEDQKLDGFNIFSDRYTFISSPRIEDHPVAREDVKPVPLRASRKLLRRDYGARVGA